MPFVLSKTFAVIEKSGFDGNSATIVGKFPLTIFFKKDDPLELPSGWVSVDPGQYCDSVGVCAAIVGMSESTASEFTARLMARVDAGDLAVRTFLDSVSLLY